MFKIEVGKLYRVHARGDSENDNIIRISEAIPCGNCISYRYETVKGERPSVNIFDSDSIFAKYLVPAQEMIVIYRKDNKVVALDKATGKEGVARCAPDDTFNFETGAKLAFKRLVGEFVRVVGAKSGVNDKIHGFPIGQIVKVVDVMDDGKYKCEGVCKWRICTITTQIVNPDHIEKLEEA